MKYDAIVIGAGMGGLSCAAKLAKGGRKVLLLEKDHHVGGTSYIFWRGGYGFPMGPLAFSFPGMVRSLLQELGIEADIEFKRNHFQLITPFFDIVYSQPLDGLKKDLKKIFPREKCGLDAFFEELQKAIVLSRDIHLWHPEFQLRRYRKLAERKLTKDLRAKLPFIKEYSLAPSTALLDETISDMQLKNFLGSMGTYRPEMSLLTLAFMWNMMSVEGIWFPSCGLHGVANLLRDSFLKSGGEMRLATPVERMIVKRGKVEAVQSASGEFFEGEWIISNADYKSTFLGMVDPDKLDSKFLDIISQTPYSGSELCVYVGVDAEKVDLTRMKAAHLFYRKRVDPDSPSSIEDFENREIEICLWSHNAPDLSPKGKASLIFRVGFPYDHFAEFRTGEKKRKDEYRPFKVQLARDLIRTVESILPGLSSTVEVIEIATTLTYQDWGHRWRGSIAGWTWSAGYERNLGGKLLIETPVKNLLMVGVYAVSSLFLGGVPTAIHTGTLAADAILENSRPKS